MPIVDIEIVLEDNETISREMVSEIADQLGMIFGSPENGTWVKMHGISAMCYAENGGKEEGVYPIFVSILKAKWPASEEMQEEVDGIVEALAQICKREPAVVHVLYQPEGRGRVAFGGKIVE